MKYEHAYPHSTSNNITYLIIQENATSRSSFATTNNMGMVLAEYKLQAILSELKGRSSTQDLELHEIHTHPLVKPSQS